MLEIKKIHPKERKVMIVYKKYTIKEICHTAWFFEFNVFINLVYVRSDVNLGNRNHVRHTIVQAEIVRRNIPVANGVVHLIGKPLVKTAKDLWGFLKQEVDLN